MLIDKSEMSKSELCDTRRVCWQFSVARPDYKKYRHIGTCSFRPAVSSSDRQRDHSDTSQALGGTHHHTLLTVWRPLVRTEIVLQVLHLQGDHHLYGVYTE